jgi:hypothetical protein
MHKILKIIGILAIAGFFGFFLVLAAGGGYYRLWLHQAPQQPIAFPHSIHAEGGLGLPCTFCHIYAEQSPAAGVPYVEICISCHATVATERPEIQKLIRHWEEKEPIYWVRVHTLEGFIRFPHKSHLRAGLECATCHGDVTKTERVGRVRPLEMGWCVSCHRTLGASTDCATCHI